MTRIDMESTSGWHDLVRPVLPHAGQDAEVPELGAVRIEVTDAAVYAVATDRYTLAAERRQFPGLAAAGPVHLNAKDVRASLALLRCTKDENPPLKVTIDKAPFTVTVVGAKRSVDRLAITLESADGTRLVLHDERDPAMDPLAGWRKRLGKLLARNYSGAAPALTLPAKQLARWAAAVGPGERLSVFTGADSDMPILITVEEHFIGAWQPISYLTTPAEALAESPWHAELREED